MTGNRQIIKVGAAAALFYFSSADAPFALARNAAGTDASNQTFGGEAANIIEKVIPAEEIQRLEIRQDDDTVTIVLLPAVGLFAMVFYLVHWHDAAIRRFMWTVIMVSISIFIAVMSYGLIFDTIYTDIILNKMMGVDAKTANHTLPLFVLFITLWLLVEVNMYCRMGSHIRLKAIGTVGGHVVGFAALNCFMEMQTRFFLANVWTALAGVWVAAIMVGILAVLGMTFRSRVTPSEEVDVKWDDWEEQCVDTETDFISISLSYVFVQWLAQWISGALPSNHAGMCGSYKHVQLLLVIGVVLSGILVILFTFLQALGSSRCPNHTMMLRAISNVHAFWSMCGSWLGLFWGVCLAPSDDMGHDALMNKLSRAIYLFLIGTAIVFAINCIVGRCFAKSGWSVKVMRANITAVGTTIGLAWEKTFDGALENLAERKAILGSRVWTEVLVTIFAILVVYPGWWLYILPKTSKRLLREVGPNPHPLTMCWSDAHIRFMYEESESSSNDDGGEEDDEY